MKDLSQIRYKSTRSITYGELHLMFCRFEIMLSEDEDNKSIEDFILGEDARRNLFTDKLTPSKILDKHCNTTYQISTEEEIINADKESVIVAMNEYKSQ